MKKSFLEKIGFLKPKKTHLKPVGILFLGFIFGLISQAIFQESKIEERIEKIFKNGGVSMPDYHGNKPTFYGIRAKQDYLEIHNQNILNLAKQDLAMGRMILQKKGKPKIGDAITYMDKVWKVVDGKGLDKRLVFKAFY